MFTDSSKLKGSAFIGFAILNASNDTIVQYRASNKTSVFSCEAMMIIKALMYNSTKQEFCIFSDSKSVFHLCYQVRIIRINPI